MQFLKRMLAVSPAILSLILFTAAANAEQPTAVIRSHIDELRSTGNLSIGNARIAAVNALPKFYERRNFQRAWISSNAVTQLFSAIQDAYADGLNPEDYHINALTAYRHRIDSAAQASARSLADFDILLTDSLMRLSYHLYFGKVDPETINPYLNLVRTINDRDPLQLIQEAIDSDAIARFTADLKPKHAFYLRLKKALATYRSMLNVGTDQIDLQGRRLRRGDQDEHIPALRRRLHQLGDLDQNHLESKTFDEPLERALIRFQTRHAIEPNGIADQETLDVLNEPLQTRIDQIRANLERARWVMHGLPNDLVIVDIAGFYVHYVRNGTAIWSARAQVGKPYRQTPVFKSEIRSFVINPTWTVPPGVFRRDILPEVKKDTGYIDRLEIKIYDAQNRPVAAGAIDWNRYPGSKFPYILRQDPGPTNPLGDIRFNLPNPFYIYLHDTPEQEEFDSSWRALSAGCIRVENPFQLAELLYGDSKRWSAKGLQERATQYRTVSVRLPAPVPILLLYLTVWVDQDQIVSFREDIYERDAKILQGLAGEFKLRQRPLTLNPIL